MGDVFRVTDRISIGRYLGKDSGPVEPGKLPLRTTYVITDPTGRVADNLTYDDLARLGAWIYVELLQRHSEDEAE